MSENIHGCLFMDAPSALVEGLTCKRFCSTSSSVEDVVDFPCKDAKSPPEEEKNDVNYFCAAIFCQQVLVSCTQPLSQWVEFRMGNQIN